MVEINNTTQHKINIARTRRLVDYFLQVYKKQDWEVSVAVIGAARMRQLNARYRGIDKTTDVLSFRGGEKMNKFLGEIVINISETKKPGKYRSIFGAKKSPSAAYLLDFLLVHGLLHLIGYNDESEAERQVMINLGRDFLDQFSKR
jgi:probable rRNA maturation factor